jgi:adenine-specific DNA-methyltransferase
MIFPIEGIEPRKGFQWKIGREQIDTYKSKGDLVILNERPYLKVRPEEETNQTFLPFWSHFFDKDTYGTSEKGKTELTQILGTNEHEFETVKPVNLIKKILFHVNNKNCLVLDFFAGSGTTGHAVLEMNRQDGGNRHFILCTDNENKICEEITYTRLKNVMEGYKLKSGEKVAGLGGNLKYLKTDFVPKHVEYGLTDEDRLELTRRVNTLLALRENTFDRVFLRDRYEVFEGLKRLTGIYFSEDKKDLEGFLQELSNKGKGKKTTVYIFSWERGAYKSGLEEYPDFHFEDIPEPILEVYRSIGY